MALYYDSDSGRDSDEESSSGNESNSSNESEQHPDDDYVQKKTQASSKKKRTVARSPRKPKAQPKPVYIAKVTETATGVADASESTSKVDMADSNILAKIRKAMQLATHPGTGEAEARVAMRMATKLMQSQNLTQADLIANETVEERSTRAGQSTVKIKPLKGKIVRNQQWYNSATVAACTAFDVQVYSVTQRDRSLNWVFYGLADNTVAAAFAFEMLHNQIETWALERKSELKGRTAGTSYRNGVADRVWKDADKVNKEALRQAEEAERKRLQEEAEAAEAARAAELARLAMPVVNEPAEKKPVVTAKVEDAPDEDSVWPTIPADEQASDDDSDYGDGPRFYDRDTDMDHGNDAGYADFNDNDHHEDDIDLDALEEQVKIKAESGASPAKARRPPPPPTSPVKPEPVTETVEFPPVTPETEHSMDDGSAKVKAEAVDDAQTWSSALQLRTFRDNAKTIAETYLKDTKTKVRKGRKRKALKYDHSAFQMGWDDGQKVDLKRRKIEGKDECKEEPE